MYRNTSNPSRFRTAPALAVVALLMVSPATAGLQAATDDATDPTSEQGPSDDGVLVADEAPDSTSDHISSDDAGGEGPTDDDAAVDEEASAPAGSGSIPHGSIPLLGELPPTPLDADAPVGENAANEPAGDEDNDAPTDGDVTETTEPKPVAEPVVPEGSTPVVERGVAEVVEAPPAPAEVETPEPEPEPVDPGLRADEYDGVYAQGIPVWIAMSATRQLESGGDYAAAAGGSSASGAYQVIDSTWAGYGGYARAVDAPAAVQDQFAYESMVTILKRFGNDVSAIPLAWYYPAALRNESLMDVVPLPEAGNVLTPRQYQARWMSAFHRLLEDGSPVFLPADTDALIPAIAFPVLGPTWFYDDWHAPRDGGDRVHEGLDFLGVDGQPVRAAFDGVVTMFRPHNVGRPGIGITITRDDGLRANYFHLDTELRWHPDLVVGDTVKAGQVIAYMGSTGNAGIPHLHFELRTDEGEPIAPYAATLEAIQREQCSVGIGPWSTEFSSPAEIAEAIAAAELAAAEAAERGDEPIEESIAPEPLVYVIEGPDDAVWVVSSDGSVKASGRGALVAPDQGACSTVPEGEFGTDAQGVSIDLLPEDWWGEDIEPDELAEMIAAVVAERSQEFDDEVRDAFDRMRIGPRRTTPTIERPDGAILRPFQR